MIPFRKNFKTQAKLIYVIRDTYNNDKNIKKSKEVITGEVRLMVTSKQRVLWMALQVILIEK